jgi:peptidylprolyl isomerase
MSSIRYSFFLIASFLVLLSCEDTKKRLSENEYAITKETASDTANVKNNNEQTKEDQQSESIAKNNEYPKINQKNVVSFLTEYGKENPETRVKITTHLGDIYIELFRDTPLHRANFIYLVKQGYFDDTFFHRVVPDFIIQGGNSDNRDTPRKRMAIGSNYLLPSEVIPGRNHQYGTVSGAKEYRENPDKKTFPFEFFIFLGPIKHTKHLNGNYTIFGRVYKGMDVVEKIANLPADKGEWPIDNVYLKVEVIE